MKQLLTITFLYLSCSFLCPLAAAEKEPKKKAEIPEKINRDFGEEDSTAKEWFTQDGGSLKTAQIDDEHGDSLIVPAKFPGLVQAHRGSKNNPVYLALYNRFGQYPTAIVSKIGFDIFVPEDVPSGARVGCTFFTQSKDGVWFQAHPVFADTGEPATALNTGWNRLEADISETSGYMEPVGHREVWSRTHLGLARKFGFNIFCDQKYSGDFAIDNFTAWMTKDKFDDKFSIVSLQPGSQTLPRMQMYEASFRINRPLLNPYNTKEIDIVAEIRHEKDEKPVIVPAFFYQDYQRAKGSDKDGEDYRDRYLPLPETEFRIRYTPQKTGNYTCLLRAKYTSVVSEKSEECTSEELSFTVSDAAAKGFVRISGDKRCFEFMDGSFFYPVGYNFHSPIDTRHNQRILRQYFPDVAMPNNRELRTYESAIPRMKEAGINAFEVWMSSWWLELEWTNRWQGYNGLNYYNQEHAWKLDSLLKSATENGLYLHLVIDNHGQASRHCDPEWNDSPYYTRNGGPFQTPEDFFGSKKGIGYYKDKYRYIAARWGFSPNIFGFELWSELNLTGSRGGKHKSAEIYKWVETMATWLRKQDQGEHLITIHYSGDYKTIDQDMVRKSFIDYIVGDAYHPNNNTLTNLLEHTQRGLYGLNKPYVMTEYCGNFNASSIETMFGDMYSGLWFSWCTNAAGGPFSWWHQLINQENYYPVYAAFTRYTKGEDKRRKAGEKPLTVDWNTKLSSSGSADAIKEIEKLAEEDRKASEYIDPKTKKKKVKRRPFRTVINGKRYELSSVQLLAKIKEMAKEMLSYKAQTLGDGTVFYSYVFEENQLDRMPLDDKMRKLASGVAFELKTDAAGTFNIEVWDCYQGKIVKTYENIQTDENGTLRVNLPPFKIQCALKIRKTDGKKP